MNTSSLNTSLLLLASFIAACQPVIMTPPNQNVIITNEIFKTEVLSDSDFTMVIDGIVFEAKPVDAMNFDGNQNLIRAKVYDGGFIFVDVVITQEGILPYAPEKQNISTRVLLPKLIGAGINNEHARLIIRQIADNIKTSERYMATNGDYHKESIVGADPKNLFTFDDRYLSLFSVSLSNQGNLMKEFCLPTLRLHTATDVYEPFEKEKLLNKYPYGTVNYEVMNQLLASPCIMLPPQTTIDRYLAFPAVSYNDRYRLTAQTGNQLNSVVFSVKHTTSFERFVFGTARIQVKGIGDIVLSVQTSTPGVYMYSEVMRTSYIFLESRNDIIRVDNNEFLLQENMDAGVYHVIVVRQQGDVYKVDRVPLDPSTLVGGVILVDVGD